MKTGLFGGSFDPVHSGHLIIAETLRADYPLDRVIFIPAAIPPATAIIILAVISTSSHFKGQLYK